MRRATQRDHSSSRTSRLRKVEPEPLSSQVTAQRADAGQRSGSGPGRPAGGFRATRQGSGAGDRPPVSRTGHRKLAETQGRGRPCPRGGGLVTWDSAPAGGSLGRTSWSSTAKTCLLDTAQKRRSQEPGERLERDARHGTTTQINFQTLGREGTELRCNQKKNETHPRRAA